MSKNVGIIGEVQIKKKVAKAIYNNDLNGLANLFNEYYKYTHKNLADLDLIGAEYFEKRNDYAPETLQKIVANVTPEQFAVELGKTKIAEAIQQWGNEIQERMEPSKIVSWQHEKHKQDDKGFASYFPADTVSKKPSNSTPTPSTHKPK